MNPNLLPVTIYTQPNCQPCRLTKDFFNRNGIRYTEIDVTVNSQALEKIQSWNYTQAPVIFIPFDYPEEMAGSHWSGLVPDNLNKLVALLS